MPIQSAAAPGPLEKETVIGEPGLNLPVSADSEADVPTVELTSTVKAA